MSRIDELLTELCPQGVNFLPLWQITTWDKRFNAVDRSKQPNVLKYRYLLAKEMVPLIVEGGDVKLLTTHESDLWTTEEVADGPIYDAEIIAIPWGGNAIVQHFQGRFLTSDNRIAVATDPTQVNMKFVYYFIRNNLDVLGSFYRGSGIKHPSMSQVLDWRIPVPPLQVQGEIVRILDTFTELEAELEAELETRRQQYSYCLRSSVSPSSDSGWTTLGAATVNHDRKRRPVTRADRKEGKIPYYGANGVQDYVEDYIFDGTFLLVGEDGSVINPDGSPILNWASGKIWVNNHAHVLTVASEQFNLRFLYYYLATIDVSRYVTGGTQPKINQKNLNLIPVPLVPRDFQDDVVFRLDTFDSLVNDLDVGLPAELAARRKQYEYYRNKLLTFEEAAA